MYLDALKTVLQSADAACSTLFGPDDIARWPSGALEALVRAGLLGQASHATSVVCDGCEEACLSEVEFADGEDGTPLRAYVVCERREDIGRVQVPLERLRRWAVDLGGLAAVIAQNLGAIGRVEELLVGRLWWLGCATFRAGRMDVFMARGRGLQGDAREVGAEPRFQQCSRAVLLTLGDTADDLFPGKVAVSLQRLLSLEDDGLSLERQVVEDEVARRAGRSVYQVRRFPTPPGTTWDRVSIVITADEDAAQVSAGGVTEPVTPAEMGMAHPRNPSRFLESWKLLVRLAAYGPIRPDSRDFSLKTPKRVERLRDDLQAFFGIPDDPFHPYRQAGGYTPRFNLRSVR
jgi:hypothetical protein